MSIVLERIKGHTIVELKPGKVYMDDTTGCTYLVAKSDAGCVMLVDIETGGIVEYSQLSPDIRFIPITIKGVINYNH